MGLRACYSAVTAVLGAEAINKGPKVETFASTPWNAIRGTSWKRWALITAELVLSAVRRDLVS